MKHTRLFWFLISLILLLSLTACAGDPPTNPVEGDAQSAPTATPNTVLDPEDSPVSRSPLATPSPTEEADDADESEEPASEDSAAQSDLDRLIDLAQAQLIDEVAEVEAASEISVANTESREWPDSGLGCPEDEMMYLTVITPGYLIELTAGGSSYTFHTDSNDTVRLCAVDGKAVEGVTITAE
jgi:hypothetical protein